MNKRKRQSLIGRFFQSVDKGDVGRCLALLDVAPDLIEAIEPNCGRRAVHFAVGQTGRLSVLDSLLERGADINSRDSDGFTPLHLACIGSGVHDIRYLIDHGADVNARDDGGRTPLHLAATFLLTDHVETLLDHGADIDATSIDGHTPVHDAILDRNLETARFLIDRGASVDLFAAAGLGLMDRLQRMLKKGSPLLNARDAREMTALHWAAWSGLAEAASLLIDLGSAVDPRENRGWTPLMVAAFYSTKVEILSLLLAHGADPMARSLRRMNDRFGEAETALHLVAGRSPRRNDFEQAEVLIRAGADLNARNASGLTPLDLAIRSRLRLNSRLRGYSRIEDRRVIDLLEWYGGRTGLEPRPN